MKFIGRLFIWFSAEAITGALSQAIAESVSQNPFIYYPILVVLFSIGSLIATIGLFKEELEEANLI
tara:strand:+ start:1901 stop:2098 length:198 start_codon:yes stop_codon:yes gene_type:complete